MESKPVVVAVIDGQPGGAPQQPAKGKGKWVAGAILLLCLGVGLGAGLGAGLKKKSTTASTPAPPTMTLYSVASSMTLAGLTSTTFTSAARLSFASTMATSLGVASSAVAVTQVTDITTARRRVLSTGVSVNFTVASTTPAVQQAVAQSINTLASSAPALTSFTSSLNTALAAAGAPTVTNVGPPTQPIAATLTVTAPSPPPLPPPPSPSPASTPSSTPSPSPSSTPTTTPSPSPASTPSAVASDPPIVFSISAAVALGVPGGPPPSLPGGRRHLLQQTLQCCTVNNNLGATCPCGNATGNQTNAQQQPPPGNATGNQTNAQQQPPAGNAPSCGTAGASVVALNANNSISNAIACTNSTRNVVKGITAVYTGPGGLVVAASMPGTPGQISKVNGTDCFVIITNKTTGNTTCLYQNGNTSFTSLVGSALFQKNTNGGANPGWAPDLQFDSNGNVYFASQSTAGPANLLKVNAATGIVTMVGLPGGSLTKFDVAGGGNILSSGSSLYLSGTPAPIPTPAQNAASVFTNLTFANGTTIQILNASYGWSYTGGDGNLYAMVSMPNPKYNLSAYALQPQPLDLTAPGIFKLVSGTTSFVTTPFFTSNASFNFVAGTSVAVEAVCPTCDPQNWQANQNIASLPSNNTIIIVGGCIRSSCPSPPCPCTPNSGQRMLDISAPPAQPQQLSNGPFLNFSSGSTTVNQTKGAAGLIALNNATAACHGQDANGNYITTVYNRVGDNHTVLGAFNGTAMSAMGFSPSAGVLYLSGTNISTRAVVLATVLAQPPYTNITFTNTSGLQYPLANFGVLN